MNKRGEKMVAGIIVLVIGGLIVAGVLGFLNTPKPVRIVQGEDEVCPVSSLFGNDDEGSFEIKLKNTRSEGPLFVNLISEDIMFKVKERDEFNKSNGRTWTVPNGGYQEFSFDTKRNESLDTFSIEVSYGCDKIICVEHTFCCNYKLEDRSKTRYQLINETPSC